MDKELLKRKIENPVRALAKELEGRGQMEGIVAEITKICVKTLKNEAMMPLLG